MNVTRVGCVNHGTVREVANVGFAMFTFVLIGRPGTHAGHNKPLNEASVCERTINVADCQYEMS